MDQCWQVQLASSCSPPALSPSWTSSSAPPTQASPQQGASVPSPSPSPRPHTLVHVQSSPESHCPAFASSNSLAASCNALMVPTAFQSFSAFSDGTFCWQCQHASLPLLCLETLPGLLLGTTCFFWAHARQSLVQFHGFAFLCWESLEVSHGFSSPPCLLRLHLHPNI